MRTNISKWGNSLALRVPASLANDINLFEGGQVELYLKDGGLFVLPVKKKYSLSKLLDGITDDNLHSEIDTGSPQGGEYW